MYLDKALSWRYAMFDIIVEREDEHHFTARTGDSRITPVYHVKKAAAAIGRLAWTNKKFFKLRETFGGKELQVMENKGKHGTTVFVLGHPEIKPEYAESFEIGLGQVIQHNRNIFDVSDIKHVGK